MKRTEEIKADILKLEHRIGTLLGEFLEENGSCSINISVIQDYVIREGTNHKQITSLDVKVNVIIE